MTVLQVPSCTACGKRHEDHGHPHGGACVQFETVPTNRIRVTLTFDLALEEPGFPDWLHEIVPEGINGLIDDGVAKPCGYIGRHYQFTKLAQPNKVKCARKESP